MNNSKKNLVPKISNNPSIQVIKTVNNMYIFNLKSPNGLVIATSEVFYTKAAMENALKALEKYAEIAVRLYEQNKQNNN